MYDFNGGRNFKGTTAITVPPITMSCWFEYRGTGSNQTLMMLSDFNSVEIHSLALNQGSSNKLTAYTYDSGFSTSAAGATLVAGTLYHAVGTWVSTASRFAYLDGVAGTENTDTKTPTGIDTLGIGTGYWSSGRKATFDGMIGEPAIWDVVLTQAEITSLAAGVSPLLVRPSSLTFYAPLQVNAQQYVGAVIAEDGTGATLDDIGSHPKIYRPSSQILRFPSVAVAPSGRIMSSLAASGGLTGMGGLAGKGGGLAG